MDGGRGAVDLLVRAAASVFVQQNDAGGHACDDKVAVRELARLVTHCALPTNGTASTVSSIDVDMCDLRSALPARAIAALTPKYRESLWLSAEAAGNRTCAKCHDILSCTIATQVTEARVEMEEPRVSSSGAVVDVAMTAGDAGVHEDSVRLSPSLCGDDGSFALQVPRVRRESIEVHRCSNLLHLASGSPRRWLHAFSAGVDAHMRIPLRRTSTRTQASPSTSTPRVVSRVRAKRVSRSVASPNVMDSIAVTDVLCANLPKPSTAAFGSLTCTHARSCATTCCGVLLVPAQHAPLVDQLDGLRVPHVDDWRVVRVLGVVRLGRADELGDVHDSDQRGHERPVGAARHGAALCRFASWTTSGG